MDKCNLCGKLEDERNSQIQCGFILCNSCDGLYSDEELQDQLDNSEEVA